MGESVLQDWLMELPFKEQAVLLSALRGCDVVPKSGAGKDITRALRSVALRNADNDRKSGFLPQPGQAAPTWCLDELECLPSHWLWHAIHAAQVVAYRHPDEAVSNAWLVFYRDAVTSFHVIPENIVDYQLRLRGDNGPRG